MLRNAPTLFVAILLACCPSGTEAQDAIVPDRVLDLLNYPGDPIVHLNEKASLSTNQDEIWAVDEEGHLQVSGKGMGYIRTDRKFRDYHLVMEYRWGERTLATRADRARDCGLLIHAYGEDGAYGNTWMSCIEAQLIEGGSGDILVLGSKQDDGSIDLNRIPAEVSPERDDERFWTP
jgi:hypothetical protein